MKSWLCICLLSVGLSFFLSGCTVKVTPSLSSSLGMDAFENMREINVRDVSLALYIDPKIKNLQAEQKIRTGEFTLPIGPAFSAKLIKALAYQFRTIVLVDQPSYQGAQPIDALMRVTLQDVDVTMDVKTGFAVITSESYTRIAVRAEIQDFQEKKSVWVGTTQTKETGQHQEMGQMSYQEVGRGFASGVDVAIDKAVGDLMNQMAKSPNLAKYFEIWEARSRQKQE